MVYLRRTINDLVTSAYRRVTLSRYTLLFFLSSVILCLSQGVIQSFLFGTDLSAEQMVATILHQAQVPMMKLAIHTRNNGQDALKLCSDIPGTVPGDPCVTVFNSSVPSSSKWTAPPGFRRDQETHNTHVAVFAASDNTVEIFLDEQCTRTLLYPDVVLRNSKREEIVLLASHFWLFGISCYALFFDSIPHVFAVLCMRVLESGWSAYTIWRTMDIHLRFNHLISDANSPCHADLLPTYLPTRLALQIMDLLLNLSALICLTLLGWKLIQAFSAETFKRVGPPEHIIRMQRPYYAISVCLHLTLFLTVTVLSLWADQLMNTSISVISKHTALYQALYFFTIATILPWAYSGLYAVRREQKGVMTLFLLLCVFYIMGWSLMFKEKIYQWTWLQWPFFGCMTIASLLTLLGVGISGIVCWSNFGKGLASYLEAEAQLAKSGFEPTVFSTAKETSLSRGPSRSVYNGVYITTRHDTNWDFADVDTDTKRPPIYMVQLESEIGHDSKF